MSLSMQSPSAFVSYEEKERCIQWQLSGSCCDTHVVVVGRSVEIILRDNCSTAIVHIYTKSVSYKQRCRLFRMHYGKQFFLWPGGER